MFLCDQKESDSPELIHTLLEVSPVELELGQEAQL